jgi:hypothetical protein
MIRIQISNDLEASGQRYDLSLYVFLYDAGDWSSKTYQGERNVPRYLRKKSYSDLLVENLENLFACTAFQQLAMHL